MFKFLWKCLLRLETPPSDVLKEAVHAGSVPEVLWTPNSADILIPYVKWPSAVGPLCLVFLGCVGPVGMSPAAAHVEQCLLCRLLLRSVLFLWFHADESMCDSVLLLPFGTSVTLGLTPLLVLWPHSFLFL